MQVNSTQFETVIFTMFEMLSTIFFYLKFDDFFLQFVVNFFVKNNSWLDKKLKTF